MKDLWIVVPDWDKFQHYKDREPTWIKLYMRLLHNPNFLSLSAASRGVLMTIWLLYATEGGPFPASFVPRYGKKLGGFFQLSSLNHAGFIELYSREALDANKEKEKEKEKETPTPSVDNSRQRRRRGGGADANRDLLHRAVNAAADWEGGSSETFSDALDTLEREFHAHLPVSVRERLWDEALKRERP